MATLYNKTALKKVKKDELVEMFLDFQARLNSYEIGLNGVCDACKAHQEKNKKLEEENQKLKEDIVYLKHQKSVQREKLKEFMDKINKLNKETKMWENPPDY